MTQKDYHAGLNDYWSGRPRTAIEHISKVIADNEGEDSLLPMYRLWVELLAVEGDRMALKTLAEHLKQRTSAGDEFQNTFFALRGLIDIELDHMQSAALKNDALKEVQNMYAWELDFRIKQRAGQEIESYPVNLAKDAAKFDYIFAKSYLTHLHESGDTDRVKDFSKILSKVFPENPTHDELKMHQSVDAGKFTEALIYAHELTDKHPSHGAYPVYLAYMQIKNRQYPEAKRTLTRCESIFGAEDLDVVTLQAVNNYNIFKKSSTKKHKEKSVVSLKKACEMLEQSGRSQSYHSKLLNEVLGSMDSIDPSSMQNWMLHLSQTEFAKVIMADAKSIKTAEYTIHANAKVGDLVFIMAHDAVPTNEGSNYRLGAVYQAVTDSTWHPIDGFTSELQLVKQLEMPIRIPVSSDSDNQSGKNENFVMEMDHVAFDQICETIEEFAKDEESVTDLKNQLDRLRMVG
ncbi:hypothetical protein N9D31_01890 [Oligoflexaceae bacterium]|nr:hypothetical protein [Oligoflexaceae bacterium]